MSILAIVQARMSSTRCPGKVLREAGNKPLLHYLVARLAQCAEMDQIIIATSSEKEDDAIDAFCRKEKLLCFRGPLKNVAKRFELVLKKYTPEAFVRINGDSPWIDPRLVDQAVRLYQEKKSDMVTNVQKRLFPRGQSVELLKSEAFLSAMKQGIKSEKDQEHVTSWFYENPKAFKIINFEPNDGRDYSHLQLCVDTESDWRDFNEALSSLNQPAEHADWRMIASIYSTLQNQRTMKIQ